jgi:phospholipid/cholesterol/gamma-HCH transport system permease protein
VDSSDHSGTAAGTKLERTDAGGTLWLRGAVDRYNVGSLWQRCMKALADFQGPSLVLDLREVSRVDTLGIALIERVERLCSERGIALHHRNVPESVGRFLQYVEDRSSGEGGTPPLPEREGPVSRLGVRALDALEGTAGFVQYAGSFVVASVIQLFQPHRARHREALEQLELVGARAFPLLVVLSLLFGTIMVFQAMARMRGFGADIYVADLVVIAVTREMAPLVTAIVLAGRSGSAFAAEIATMKLNEEIDALKVMDVDVMSYLVLPRVFAIVAAGPLLVMISDAFGIVGGLLSSRVVLGLPPESFLSEARGMMTAPDIYTGLIKGASFALLIGLVGCFRGLQTRVGPRAIGVQTTSAVVSGIVLVVLADAFFSYVFQLYDF